MANFYNVSLIENVLKVGFGDPAQNDEIVRDVVEKLNAMMGVELTGGSLIKINGPASLPVAVAIAHAVSHLYEVVAVYDPKLAKYVVSVSHSSQYRPGDLID
jgi:CRISPR-associated protein Csx3